MEGVVPGTEHYHPPRGYFRIHEYFGLAVERLPLYAQVRSFEPHLSNIFFSYFCMSFPTFLSFFFLLNFFFSTLSSPPGDVFVSPFLFLVRQWVRPRSSVVRGSIYIIVQQYVLYEHVRVSYAQQYYICINRGCTAEPAWGWGV